VNQHAKYLGEKSLSSDTHTHTKSIALPKPLKWLVSLHDHFNYGINTYINAFSCCECYMYSKLELFPYPFQ